jgi:hypothetical protein
MMDYYRLMMTAMALVVAHPMLLVVYRRFGSGRKSQYRYRGERDHKCKQSLQHGRNSS